MARQFVSLHFEASNLNKFRSFVVTNPFLVIYAAEDEKSPYVQVGRTTPFKCHSDPEFPDDFIFELRAWSKFRFKICAYECDLPVAMICVRDRLYKYPMAVERFLYSKDLIGEAEFTLEQLQLVTHGRAAFPLLRNVRRSVVSRGDVIVYLEKVCPDPQVIYLQLRVDNSKLLLRDNWQYIVVLYRRRRDGNLMLVDRSKVTPQISRIAESSFIDFNSLELAARFVNGDWNTKLSLRLAFKVNGSAKFWTVIGAYECSLNELVQTMKHPYSPFDVFRMSHGAIDLSKDMKFSVEVNVSTRHPSQGTIWRSRIRGLSEGSAWDGSAWDGSAWDALDNVPPDSIGGCPFTDGLNSQDLLTRVTTCATLMGRNSSCRKLCRRLKPASPGFTRSELRV